MGRRKGLFGRSKESKPKNATPQQTQEDLGATESNLSSQQITPPDSLVTAESAQSKGKRWTGKRSSSKQALEYSQHSESSGTIFVQVNEDASNSGKSSKGGSQKSWNSGRSKSQPIAKKKYSAAAKKEDATMKENKNDSARSSVRSDIQFPESSQSSKVSLAPRRLDDVSIPPNMQPGFFVPQPQFSGPVPPRMMPPPPVRFLVEELFRIDHGDFMMADRYLNLLRDALEREGTDFLNGKSEQSFDPADTFFCIQRTAEGVYSRWSDLKLRRKDREKIESAERDDGDHDDVPKNSSDETGDPKDELKNDNYYHIDEETWKSMDQITWDIFEISMWSCAVLSTVCVGPAWNYQLNDRHERLHSARLQKIRRSSHKYESNTSLASSATLSKSNRHKVSFHGDASNNTKENISSAWQPRYPVIPEVLPISMLQFAANFGDAILPTTKYDVTKVILTQEVILTKDTASDRDANVFDPADYASSIEQTIWEEQRSLIRRQRVGEAQRELVSALNDANYNIDIDDASTTGRSTSYKKKYRWNIPGAHEPVALMVDSWLETTLIGWPDLLGTKLELTDAIELKNSTNVEVLWNEIAKNGALDWWNAFLVSKSVSDLTQAGWRPPPEGRHGEDCILRLVTLAEKGIKLNSRDMKNDPKDIKTEAREEILAASSASSEALAALNHLGGRGCLPKTTVKVVAHSLCQLLSLTDESISNSSHSLPFLLANSYDLSGSEDIGQDIDSFVGLRMACLHEIAELLWSMMARHSSMASTTDALLSAVDVNLSSDDSSSFEKAIFSACGAVRSLGASLWGSPPLVKGNSSLRLCWSTFFQLLCETSSSIHDWSKSKKSPVDSSVSTTSSSSYTGRLNEAGNMSFAISFQTTPKLKYAHEYLSLSLNFILEVSVAVRRLVDGDMAGGLDILCLHEWEQFLNLLERGFLPWLAVPRFEYNDIHFENEILLRENAINEELMQKIQAEVSSVFLQIKIFLTYRDDGAISSHRIVHETVRTRFYSLFFRMVSPLLPAIASTHIALSIVDSWMNEDSLSFSIFEWHRKCSFLLREAFAYYEKEECGYDGNYLHSPSVRQAAIRSLVQTDYGGPKNVVDNGSLSSVGGSTDIDPFLIARNARSGHVDVVCRLLIPYISEILQTSTIQNGLRLPEPNQFQKQEELSHESQMLLLSTIQIVGDLLIFPSLDHRDRAELLSTLRKCALEIPTTSRRNTTNGLLGDVLKLNDYGEICKPKLEAVRQLGLYLRASFEAKGGSRAPDIINILSEIVQSFYNSVHYQVIASAALFQLSCIRQKRRGEAMLLDEISVLNSFPASTKSFNERIIFATELISSHKNPNVKTELQQFDAYSPENLKGVVSSSWIHIFVSDDCEVGESKSRRMAQLNLRPLIDTLKCVLNASLNKNKIEGSQETSRYLRFIMSKCDTSFELKALCFETLHGFVQSGLVKQPMRELREISPLVDSTATSLSQCKLLSFCAPFIAQDPESNLFFQHLLTSSTSNNNAISRVACQALSTCFATVSIDHNQSTVVRNDQWHQKACSSLVEKIQLLIGSRQENVLNTGIPLLTTLLDAISSYNPSLHSLSDRTKAEIVILCHQICTDFSGMCPHTYLLCLQCASKASATIGMDELINLVSRISERQDTYSHTRSISGDTEHMEFANIILDIQVQHCLAKYETRGHRVNSVSRSEVEQIRPECILNEIELVAKEIADIESFEVAPFGGHGAWLFNDLVLICRVGSEQSRYRGWVEIILRSPSTRVRSLVRLSNQLSLKRYDLPSTLWDAALTYQGNKTTQNYREPLSVIGGEPSTVDSKLIAEAKEAMERFQDFNDKARKNQGFETHSQSSLRSFMGFSPDEMSTINSSRPPEDKSPNIIKSPPESDGGFRHFLYTALLGNEENIREVEGALHEFDCSIPILDSVYDYSDGPLPLNWDPKLRRAINVLDRTAYLQTHKVSYPAELFICAIRIFYPQLIFISFRLDCFDVCWSSIIHQRRFEAWTWTNRYQR